MAVGVLLLVLGLALASPGAAAAPAGSIPIGWSGWRTIPGGMRTQDSPEVVVNGSRLYVFVRKPNGRIAYTSKGSKAWASWKVVPGTRRTPSAPAAVVFNQRIHVFIRGLNDRIYRAVLSGTGWSAWKEVPGGGLTSASPTAGTNDDDAYRLVVRGTDDTIYQNIRTFSGWSGWSAIPGNTQVAPDLSWSGGYELALFVLGTDLHLYRRRAEPSFGAWSGWEVVPGGQVGSRPANVYYNAALAEDAADFLFVRMADGGVYFRRWIDASWGSWKAVPGGFSASGPAVADFKGRLWLVVRERDDFLQFNRYDPRPITRDP